MLTILISMVLSIIASYCLVYILWNRMIAKYRNFIFTPTVPLFGHTLSIPLDPHEAIMASREMWRNLGSKFITWLGPKPILMCSDASWLEKLLKSPNLIIKSEFYLFFHDLLGTGLLTSTGSKWKKRRKMITPAFHFSILKDFLDIFHEQSLIFVDKLEQSADKQEPIDIQVHAKLLTLDIICETAMGVKIAAQTSYYSDIAEAALNLNDYFYQRSIRPHLWPNFMMRITRFGRNYLRDLNMVHSFVKKVILSRIDERSRPEYTDGGRKIFLDILLDAYSKGYIDLDGIQEEVTTFMGAGTDTSASCISWTLYLLSLHQEIQQKVQQEVDFVLEADDQSLVTVIGKLNYLECVIKESLRLYPPASVYGRFFEKDTVIGNDVVPKGTNLMVSTYGLHMDERYWTKPEEFIPDRFMKEECIKRHPFQYLPFSAGPRNCIGQKFAMMEIKLVLFNVLRQFSFTTSQSVDQVKLQEQVILHSSNGLWLKVHRRSMRATN